LFICNCLRTPNDSRDQNLFTSKYILVLVSLLHPCNIKRLLPGKVQRASKRIVKSTKEVLLQGHIKHTGKETTDVGYRRELAPRVA